MKITDDLLTDVNHEYKTVKFSSNRNICDFLIIHYTGSYEGIQGDINQCLNPEVQVSWHLTISRDGTVYQHADFRKVTWHAGKSEWFSNVTGKTYKNLNGVSIGIELDNAGRLKNVNGGFRTAWNQIVPLGDVCQDENGDFWEEYPEDQIQALNEVSKAITKKYKCVEILGHEDIAPLRKTDPGPAFDMQKLRRECGK